MQKIYLSAIILLALNTLKIEIANAKNPTDSIGVENIDGLKVIIYQAAAKETYYSIARRYNISPKDILSYNDNKYLKVGTIIKVPTKMPFAGQTASTGTNNDPTSSYFSYTILPKDNLNLLAERYGTTISTLKEINNLSGSNLSIGQVLKIPATEKAVELGAVVNNPTVVGQKENNSVERIAATDDAWTEHVVKPREFLNKIADEYGTSVDAIKKLNNLSGNHLQIGQKLKIPTSKNVQENSTAPVQQLPVTTATDANGMHKVVNGENIFSLSKQFGITAYQIRKANNLDDNNLKVGQMLKIPSNISVDVAVPVDQQSKQGTEVKSEPVTTTNSFEYLVANGDDIYNIAKKFDLTTYQITKANGMATNKLVVGQKIIIPKPPEPLSVNQASIEAQTEHPDSLTLKDPKLRRDPSVYGLSQVEEKGTGVWISDQDLDGSKMLVLHRTAPIGTVIKITNPMTNISTFAKVVGKFTENESTKDVIIVMTKAVADSLGALDKRFLCNLMYAQ